MHWQKQEIKQGFNLAFGFSAFCSFLLGLLVLLASCSEGAVERNGLYEGTEGLKISLSSPRTEYYVSEGADGFIDQVEIPFILGLENLGRARIEEEGFRLELFGFDPRIISTTPRTFEDFNMEMNVITLRDSAFEGVSLARPLGNRKAITGRDIEFGTKKDASIPGDSYQFNLKANLCYRYKTYFSDSFIVSPRGSQQEFIEGGLYDRKDYGEKGQGAPIAVTRAEVEPIGNKARVTFYIKRLDNVEIYYNRDASPKKDECGSVRFENRNKVLVSGVWLSGAQKASCLEKEFYLDAKGEGIIDCIFDEGVPSSSASTVISLELEYDVFDSASLGFRLRKI